MTRCAIAVVAIALALTAEPLFAQTAVPPPAAAPAATRPAPPTWTHTLTAGGTWVSPPFTQGQLDGGPDGLTGATLQLPGAQLSAQVGLTTTHNTPRNVVSLSASFTYAEQEPHGRVTEATAIDADYSRVLTPRTYVVSRSSFRRDTVRNIDNSFVELAGFGVRAVDHKKLRIDVVLGGALMRENKNTRFDDTLQPQLGGMETIVITPNPGAQWTHRLTYRVGVRESTIWSIESYTGFQGAVTKRLSVTIGLTWNYDDILGDAVTSLPPNALFAGSPALTLRANQRMYRQLTTGLQFSF
jgi:hypothetical protein